MIDCFLAKINNFHIQYNRQISLKPQKDQACQTESIFMHFINPVLMES